MKLKFELQISKEELELLQGKQIDEAKKQAWEKAEKLYNKRLEALTQIVKAVVEATDEENFRTESTPVNTNHAENQQEMEDTHEEVVLSTPIEEHHIDAAANAFGVTKSRVREILEYYGVTTFEEFLNHPDIPVEYKNYVNEYL